MKWEREGAGDVGRCRYQTGQWLVDHMKDFALVPLNTGKSLKF